MKRWRVCWADYQLARLVTADEACGIIAFHHKMWPTEMIWLELV